jgi:hypothetical protein
MPSIMDPPPVTHVEYWASRFAVEVNRGTVKGARLVARWPICVPPVAASP